jgi:hypothetical protein
MDERYEAVLCARTRPLVDELDAASAQLRQRFGEILDPQRDVMESRPAPIDEPRNRGVRGGRLEQLDRCRPGREELRTNAL